MKKRKLFSNVTLDMKSLFQFNLFIMLFSATLLSCSDDDTLNNGGEEKTTYDSAQVIVLSHDKFLNSADVLVSNDTSYITVSKPYLKVIGKEMPDSSFVVVWRANNELPFVRQILSSSDTGNNRLKVNLGPAEFSQVIPPGEYNLTTDLYTNPNEKARTNDGGINGNYYREVVTGDSIVYHPVAIIPDKREVTNDDNMHMASSIDSIPFTMVEDLQKTNFNFDATLLHASLNIYDLYLPFGEDSLIRVGFANLAGEINLGMRMKLETGVDWKRKWLIWYPSPYLDEFRSSIYGKFGVSYDFRIGVGYTGDLTLPPYTLMEFTSYNTVFWLGPVPVYIKTTPSLVVEFLGSFKAGVFYKCEGSYAYNYELGCAYKRYGGWSKFSSSGTESESSQSGCINGELYAELGLFMKADAKVFGCAGPTLRIGPSLQLNASGELDYDRILNNDYKPDVEAELNFLLGAFVGAELSVAGWTLTSWEYRFNIFEYNLWKYPSDNSKRAIDPERPLILQ